MSAAVLGPARALLSSRVAPRRRPRAGGTPAPRDSPVRTRRLAPARRPSARRRWRSGWPSGRRHGCCSVSSVTSSRCSFLRRSTIDTNGRMAGGSAIVGEEVGELVERALRQRGRDRRHEQRVGGGEHALAGQRDARRAVEDRDVVQIGERFQQRGEPAGRPFRVVEVQVEVAEREVGGDEVEPGVIGGVDVGRRAIPSSPIRRSAPPLTTGLTRKKNVAAPCGSRSHSSTRAPERAAS